jgi:hypothetical protein
MASLWILMGGKVSLIRVSEVAPSATPPLQDIKADVTKAYYQHTMNEVALKSAQKVADAYNKDKASLPRVLRELGHAPLVRTLNKVNRLVLMEGARMGKDLVQKIFSLESGKAMAEGIPGGAMVYDC